MNKATMHKAIKAVIVSGLVITAIHYFPIVSFIGLAVYLYVQPGKGWTWQGKGKE